MDIEHSNALQDRFRDFNTIELAETTSNFEIPDTKLKIQLWKESNYKIKTVPKAITFSLFSLHSLL